MESRKYCRDFYNFSHRNKVCEKVSLSWIDEYAEKKRETVSLKVCYSIYLFL